MAATEPLDIIKTLAKKLGRARRITHISALDLSSKQLGHAHWNALTADYRRGVPDLDTD